ncbi:Regulatory protein cys-3 [Cytospora mali]|uniref:Regulatory protein cys-3 n=1 Tax=Cytospora mali TaxID=578113 RepID=A0A194VT42_CYTMA|nr:Regulatory protein cys-3 [Valsa mali]
MANYGRQGSNLAQFMREQLNTVQPNEPEEEIRFDDLDVFTNTEFYDFDTHMRTDFKPASDSPPTSKSEATSATSMMGGEFGNMDMITPGEFNFGDFNSTYASPTLNNFPDSLGSLQPIQPNPQTVYPPVPQHAHQHAYSHHAASQSKAGDARRASEVHVPSRSMSIEDVSRVAAEEDKRRRNTAASARFRVKKKQREQALEKSAKEMSDKVSALEQKITQLETENQWLKKLVLEKNEGSNASKEDITKIMNGNGKEGKTEDEIHAKTDGEPAAKKAKVDAKSS